MGRPIIYKEPRKDFLLKIPTTLYKELNKTAVASGISVTEFINALVVQGDKERALLLAKSYEGLRKTMSSMLAADKEHQAKFGECIKKLSSYIGGNISESIYCAVEPDEIAQTAFGRIREKFLIMKGKNTSLTAKQMDYWVEILYREMEKVGFERNKLIKNKTLAEKMLRKIITENAKTRNPQALAAR